MNNKNNSIVQDKMRKINKKYFLMFVGYQFFRIFCAYSQVILLPLIRIMLLLIGIDLYMCEVIINAFNLLLLCAPSVCFFIGITMLSNDLKLLKDSLISEEVNNFKNDRAQRRKMEKEELEEKEKDMNELINDFRKLPRSQQMKVLNQLKEKRNLGNIKNIAVSDKLQDEFEDILFSDFDENETKKHTRKRIKK